MTQTITETIGVDLGDKYSAYCVLDQGTGEEVTSGRIRTRPADFKRFFASRDSARVVMETGTHSPWASRIVTPSCAETYVANSRTLRFIYGNTRKSDETDAESLARVGRADPKLLSAIRHRGALAAEDLTVIRARDAMVRSRTRLVLTLRGLVKSWGARLPSLGAESIGLRTREHLPEPLRERLTPLLHSIELLTEEIAQYDREIRQMARERYPETSTLSQVWGVGDLTALTFVLTLEDPSHFTSSRTVGAFLGLVPRRDQSGETEKELRITKAGDALVRTHLVECAQRILQTNAPDTDLKRSGERIAARGGKVAKRKAVTAVARKLAVLLHSLWKTGEVYEPLRNVRAA